MVYPVDNSFLALPLTLAPNSACHAPQSSLCAVGIEVPLRVSDLNGDAMEGPFGPDVPLLFQPIHVPAHRSFAGPQVRADLLASHHLATQDLAPQRPIMVFLFRGPVHAPHELPYRRTDPIDVLRIQNAGSEADDVCSLSLRHDSSSDCFGVAQILAVFASLKIVGRSG